MVKKVLTIAGSDSGGGAGIQADIKTLTAHGVYASSVLTSLTSQNTLGVNGIHEIPLDIVQKQLEAVLRDIGTDAIKIGMLSSSEVIDMIVTIIKKYNIECIVLDPVMVSSSGTRLLDEDAVYSLSHHLFPACHLITPNVPEAQVLLEAPDSIKSVDDMKAAAKKLSQFGSKNILLKGGHLPLIRNNVMYTVDVLYEVEKDTFYEVEHVFVDSKNTHGTGCTLSSAIAANLVKGDPVPLAVTKATHYVHDAIEKSLGVIGRGTGPLNHFHNFQPVAYSGSFFDALKDSLPDGLWDSYINSEFVRELAKGTLPKARFLHFIRQNYHYLRHFARNTGVAAFKARTMEECANSTNIILYVNQEVERYLKYGERWGLSKEDMDNTLEDSYTIAYTRFLLDVSIVGDILDHHVAIAPCLFGYVEFGQKYMNDPATKKEGNPYWDWLNDCTDEILIESTIKAKEQLDQLGKEYAYHSQSKFKQAAQIFKQATSLEIQFWHP